MSSPSWEPRNLSSLLGFTGGFATLAQAGPVLLWWALSTFPARYLVSNKDLPRNSHPPQPGLVPVPCNSWGSSPALSRAVPARSLLTGGAGGPLCPWVWCGQRSRCLQAQPGLQQVSPSSPPSSLGVLVLGVVFKPPKSASHLCWWPWVVLGQAVTPLSPLCDSSLLRV